MADIAATLPSPILPSPVQGVLAGRTARPTPRDILQDNRLRPRPEGPGADAEGVRSSTPRPPPGPVANQLLVQLYSQAPGDETTDTRPPTAPQKTGIAAYRSAQSIIPPEPPAPEDAALLVVQDHPAFDLTV